MTEKTAAATLIIAVVLKHKRERAAQRKKKIKWVKQWLLQRRILGVYDALLADLYELSKKIDQEIFLLVNLTLQILWRCQTFWKTFLSSLLQKPAYQISHRPVIEAP